MEYKRVKLESAEAESFLTALKFEIATARCDGVRLLRIDIDEKRGADEIAKFYSAIKKELRLMKRRGKIQLFAFPDSFERQTTEAVFLLNKYPEIIKFTDASEFEVFIFLML